jgi:hypothetical protein
MAAECDTDHYLVVAIFRERVAITKDIFHMVRLNLKNLNEVEAKE